MGYGEVEQILCAALAMLVSGDRDLKTKRDMRLRVEQHAKYVRAFADLLKDAKDTPAVDILDVLRLRVSSPN